MTNYLNLTEFGITEPLRVIETGDVAMGDVHYRLLTDVTTKPSPRYFLTLDGIPAKPDPITAIIENLETHIGISPLAWLLPGSQGEVHTISTRKATKVFDQLISDAHPNGRLCLEVHLDFPEEFYGL